MEKIGIKDIVALATAGYKPSEVKELLSLANQSEDEPAKEGEKEKVQAGQLLRSRLRRPRALRAHLVRRTQTRRPTGPSDETRGH